MSAAVQLIQNSFAQETIERLKDQPHKRRKTYLPTCYEAIQHRQLTCRLFAYLSGGWVSDQFFNDALFAADRHRGAQRGLRHAIR